MTDLRNSTNSAVSERTNGVSRFSHLDRLGTNAKTTDPSGNVVDSRSYDAFGVPVSISNPTGSQKGFASAFGAQEDAESGLELMGHRYYDPSTGRFLTRDPAQEGRNGYGYCESKPLKRIDPTGLVTWQGVVTGLGFIALGILLAPETMGTGTAIAWGAAWGALGGGGVAGVDYGYTHPGDQFVTKDFDEAVVTGYVEGGVFGGATGGFGIPPSPIREVGPSIGIAPAPVGPITSTELIGPWFRQLR